MQDLGLLSLFGELEFPAIDAGIPCSIFRNIAEKWRKYRAYRPNKVDFGPKKDEVFPVNGNNREFAGRDAFAPDCVAHHFPD